MGHGRKPPNPQGAPKSHGKKPPKPPAHSNSGSMGTSGRSYVWAAVAVMSLPALGIVALAAYFMSYYWAQS